MAIKVGINGFGRIGRNVVRAGLHNSDIEFVAVNDLTDTKTLAHLVEVRFGARHPSRRRSPTTATSITVGGKTIKVFATKDPARTGLELASAPQIVIESTGRFTDAQGCRQAHARHREEGHHFRAREE